MHFAAISGIVDVDEFGFMLDAIEISMTYSMLISVVESHAGGRCAFARTTFRDFSGDEVGVRLSACHFAPTRGITRTQGQGALP